MKILIQPFHHIRVPPIFSVIICFIIGILLYNSAFLPFFICFSSLSSLFYLHKNNGTAASTLILCLFSVYFGMYLHHATQHDYDNFYLFTNNQKITLLGTVVDKNQVLVQSKKVTVITLLLHAIKKDNCTKKNDKFVLLYGANNTMQVADVVTIYDIICKKPSNENFQQYQIKEQIIATVFDHSFHYTIDYHPSWSIRRWIWEQKTRLFNAIQNKLSFNGFMFFSSLFLGNRFSIKNSLEKTNDQFKTWGISHFLARSGLHLALFIIIWQTIFYFIPLSITIKQYSLLILSFIYFILTWTSIPFTRSFALFLLNKICFFSRHSFYLLHYLILVCFIFLLYCPMHLFFLDFQLTFALTFALAWLHQLSLQHPAD